MELAIFDSVDALPPDCRALLRPDPLAGPAWYRTVAAYALPPQTRPCFVVLTQDRRPCAVVPLARRDAGHELGGLGTPYTCTYQPALTDPGDPALALAVGHALGRFCRSWATVRIDAVPAEWPELLPFIAGLRRAGLAVQRFQHFGNWHEPVAGRSWAAYLADRPGELRTTVRRKFKRAEQEARLEVVRDGPRLEPAIAAFQAVYEASWKQPEPFPQFNPALMRAASAIGALRLAVLWVGERPAAVQFWVLADGCATVLKLAHDEAFKPFSPGTVLTAMTIRAMLDGEGAATLDFGRGDDPYKALWTTRRRERIGLLLMNPWRPRGALALAGAFAGRLRMRS